MNAEMYPRILDLVQRIRDCDAQIRWRLAEGKVGGIKALGLASQIVADAQELRALLQARNETMNT
jgi:hypothetical protein